MSMENGEKADTKKIKKKRRNSEEKMQCGKEGGRESVCSWVSSRPELRMKHEEG